MIRYIVEYFYRALCFSGWCNWKQLKKNEIELKLLFTADKQTTAKPGRIFKFSFTLKTNIYFSLKTSHIWHFCALIRIYSSATWLLRDMGNDRGGKIMPALQGPNTKQVHSGVFEEKLLASMEFINSMSALYLNFWQGMSSYKSKHRGNCTKRALDHANWQHKLTTWCFT